MKKALFSGTFYPPTLGHLDIIQRSVMLCDKLYVGIAENPNKKECLLSLEERKEMLRQITSQFPQVEVVHFSTLLVHYAQAQGIGLLIRSLRGVGDLEREYAMAVANKQMAGIETVFLLANPSYEHISSTLVREIASFGGSLKGFVPPSIEQMISKKLCNHI